VTAGTENELAHRWEPMDTDKSRVVWRLSYGWANSKRLVHQCFSADVQFVTTVIGGDVDSSGTTTRNFWPLAAT
jgi:hypothetical protein